ncbi:Dynactin subunit 3 [Frankliniella fusca]|uniref:Dynactin subunit 3 n=1 Tax=Frankliniella fusca TaxID=407009 RepID=A0AAE1LM32_9NEOP|nr:Dynactin subunit 3 [Frankliniella fusca]
MDPLNLLDDRISELERKVLGTSGSAAAALRADTDKLSVLEALSHANQLLNSALSGREKALAVMQRISELNRYMDPTFEDSTMTCEAKLEIILARERELRQDLSSLEQAQRLVSNVLDNQNAISSMQAVSGLSGQLEKLTLITIDSVQGVEALNEQAQDLFERYNSIVKELTRAFMLLDEMVSTEEQRAKPKKKSSD